METYENGSHRARTFARFARDVDRVRNELAAAKVVAGSRVGIRGDNGYAWLVHDLALTEMGAVPVAFPCDDPEPSSDLIERCGLELLLEGPDLGDRTAAGARAATDLELVAGDHSLVFSSGTAGNRKGMIATRAGADHLLRAFCDAFGLGEGERVLVFMPLSGYQQRLFVYAAVVFGWDIVMLPPLRLFAGLRELAPTVVIGPPLLFDTVLRGSGGSPRSAFGGGPAPLLISGMAALRASTADAYEAAGLPIYQVYGLNECGLISANTPGARKLGSVGRPLPGTEVTIAEDGEIVARKCAPLCRGYFAAPEAGADTRFGDGGLLYTGDLGRIDGDGYLHFCGRKKNTIVLAGGEKLQPEALELELQQCEAIGTAVVLGDDTLFAPVAVIDLGAQPTEGAVAAARSWIARLGDRRPPWAAIGRMCFASEPFSRENGLLTPVMKVDRGAILRRYGAQLGLRRPGS